MTSSRPHPEAGFTLTELAVVLAIVGLLIVGGLLTLSAQNAAREVGDTQRRLELARDAIIGFAIRFNRLPCPAAPGTTGVESVAANGACTNPYNGFLPGAALGLSPLDAQGYLLDAWGNRVRYAVSPALGNKTLAAPTPPCPPTATPPNYALCPAFTTTNAMKSLGFDNLPATAAQGLLQICDNGACTGVVSLAPAVVWSPGKNFPTSGAPGTDEQENTDSDAIFVSHEPRPAGSAAEYDDVVLWISPNVLFYRLISAGAL